MAFQAPHTERSFARQEAHWQRNTMQPLSIVMIVIWSFWRAKLGQSSSPAARVRCAVGARAVNLSESKSSSLFLLLERWHLHPASWGV